MDHETLVKQLSDEQLFTKLRDEWGYKCGPITVSTRVVYEKKLLTFLNSPKNAASLTPAKSNSLRSPSSASKATSTPNGNPNESSSRRMSTRTSSTPAPSTSSPAIRSRKSLPLDSAVSPSPKSVRPNIRTSRRVTINESLNPVIEGVSLSNYSSGEDEDEEPSPAIQPILPPTPSPPQQPTPATVKTRPSILSKGSGVSPRLSMRPQPNASDVHTVTTKRRGLVSFSDSEPESDQELTSSFQVIQRRRTSSRKSAGNNRQPIVHQVIEAEDRNGSSVASSSNWISLSILIVSIVFFMSLSIFYIYNVYDFKSIANFVSLKTSSDSSRIRSPDMEEELISKLNFQSCVQAITSEGSQSLCIDNEGLIRPAVRVIDEIRQVMEKRLISYYCDNVTPSHGDTEDPSIISVEHLRRQVMPGFISSKDFNSYQTAGDFHSSSEDPNQQKIELFHKTFDISLVLIQTNYNRFRLGFVLDKLDGSVTHITVDPSSYPMNWPIYCRMRLGLIRTFWYLVTISIIGVITYILFYFMNLRKEQANREQKIFYDLLEKSLELLQSPDEPGHMPVLHIRDTLISPLEKKDHSILKAWSRVVNYIEDRESRVQVGFEEIEGETFKTWRWVCPNLEGSNSGCTLRTGTIEWQGQAFNEREEGCEADSSKFLSRKSTSEPFVAPTSFLKVRNMFSVKTLEDPQWKAKISNAVLEKCSLEYKDSTHGIYHIHIDDRNAREGLVYVKCADVKTASLAYKALHGWWCQGRLVSVRFLKEDRYYQRFPEAATMNTPLQPLPVDE